MLKEGIKQAGVGAGWPSAALRGVALATLLAAGSTAAFAQEAAFKIGGIGTFSGPFGVLGESIRKGAELAVEMRGGKVLGVPVTFDWEDDETKPQVAVQKATRLMSDGAHMLIAPVSSGSTLAITNLAAREETPLLVTISASDDITGKSGNPYTFRTANTSNMDMRMSAVFARSAGLKKVYVAGMDYQAGRDGLGHFAQYIKDYGIEVVAEEFYPIGTKDYSILVNKIMQSDADGVMIGFAGQDGINFLKQADAVGLEKKATVFGSIIMDELIAPAVGEASLGVNSTIRYHFSLDNEANKAFVEAYRAKYNEYPTQYAGEGFDGVSWFLDVVDSTGSWDKEEWLKAFRGSERPNSVEGFKQMRACDNQAAQLGFMGKAVAGTGDLPPITMQITETFQVSDLFDPCP